MLASMSEPLLRSATADDVDGIKGLVVAAFEKYVERMGRAPSPMTADYAELLRTSRVWVLLDGDQLVGVLVTRAEVDHLLLDIVAIAPTAQGGGHGRRLLERADLDARESGLTEIRLCTHETMTENLAYYPRRGFHKTSRGSQDGFNRVYFAKLV